MAATVGIGIALGIALAAAPALAQDAAPTARKTIDGTSLGGFVLPMRPVDSPCSITALRGDAWKDDDTQRLLLEGDVRVSVGGYLFSAPRALVWINRLPIGGGAATQIAVWFERAEEPTRRAGLGASGKDLLVTATYSGATELRLVVTNDRAPRRDAFMAAGEQRLATHLRALAAALPPLGARPSVDTPAVPGDPTLAVGTSLAAAVADATARDESEGLPQSIRVPASSTRGLPIFRPDGTVSFSAESLVIDEKADRVVVQGLVEIEYIGEVDGEERRLQLSAQRGVLFLAPGAIAGLREGTRSLDASAVAGIYLEGAVQASDGEYALRARQIYYDLASNRAAILDAVLRTYDRRRENLTVQVRADELRQIAANQWSSERATVSTSEFFTPHLAIGVDRVTVTKEPDGPDGAGGGVFVDAEGAGLEAGGSRLVPLPGYRGPVERIPIRSINLGYDEERGVELGTTWDLFAATGSERVEGLEAEMSVDAYTARGAGLGAQFRLDGGAKDGLGDGLIDLYGLYDTGGDDRTTAGRDVEVDAGPRGIVDASWRNELGAGTTLETQFAWISDETFASAWREGAFNARREYETSAGLVWLGDNTALSLLAKYDLNDFLSNSYLLASRGYSVDKLPELSYRRYGDALLEGLNWTQRWSASMMQLRPTSGSPASLGIPTGAWGGAIADNGSIADAYDAAGYRDGFVTRLDTRHEVSVPLVLDWITLAPFAHGQATGYLMEEFDAYTSGVDDVRLQAGIGARASMRFVKVDDAVQSRLLDLNRMRHIVEPYGTIWGGYDTLDTGELPVYDQEYEGTAGAGAAVQLGLRNTLQTQRGGAGAWRSVDWLRVDTGVVFNDEGADFTPEPVDPLDPTTSLRWSQSPIPAFYSWRPELSQWGSHLYGASTWQLSDALSLGGTATYMLEDRDFVTDEDALLPNLARASLGVEMRHSPATSTYLEYRFVAPTESELLQAGVLYRIGRRYLVAVSPQYDIRENEMRAVAGSVARTYPDFDFAFNTRYDLIEDETSLGISLSIPAGSRTGEGAGYPRLEGMPR